MLHCRRSAVLIALGLLLAPPAFAQPDVAAPETPVAEEPAVDEPHIVEEPAVDAPHIVEEPVVDAPADERAVEDKGDELTDDEPVGGEATDDAPTDDEPVGGEATDDEPVGGEAADDAPTDDAPTDGFAHREELTAEQDPADADAPVGRTNPADAAFMTLAAAVGSGGGLLAVAATSFVSTYIVVNIFRIGGFTFTSRYWRWGALGVIPVVASLAAIPIGAALGIWWGAGLRGLPLPLVDALALMILGISLGTLGGALIGGPAGLIGGSFLGPMLLLNGSFDYIIWFNGYNVALAWAFVGVPAIAMVCGAILGGVVGAAAGPVLTGTQWGLGAKASYFEE